MGSDCSGEGTAGNQEKYSDEHYLGSLQTSVSILHDNPVSGVHARDGGTSKQVTLAEIFWPVPTSCGGQMSVGSHFTVHTASSFGTFSHIDDSEVKLLDGTLSTPDKIPFGRILLPLNLTHMTPLLVGPPFGQSYCQAQVRSPKSQSQDQKDLG